MNLHTFRDVVNDKKSSLVNDLDEGDEEKDVGVLRKPVEGEEEEGADKVRFIVLGYCDATKPAHQSLTCFMRHFLR